MLKLLSRQLKGRCKGKAAEQHHSPAFQPYAEIANVFSLGDVGLIISKPGVGTNSVPSKTGSYMAAETPILTSFDLDSELCKLAQENQCGVSVETDDADALVAALLELKQNDALRSACGHNGRSYIDANLTRAIGTERYISVMKAVVK